MTNTAAEVCRNCRSRSVAGRQPPARAAWAAGLALALLALPRPAAAEEAGRPPPINVDYFQYGVALTIEQVASAGDVCPSAHAGECILGSGPGPAIRVGYRARGPWYAGGAYEFSRHDSSNLLRLAILQQLRAEGRYYFEAGKRVTPYLGSGLGAALYGNEWRVSTGGLVGTVGLGLEFQVTQSTLIGGAFGYRALLLRGWTDNTGQTRADRYLGFGLAHLICFEFTLELRDPLLRW